MDVRVQGFEFLREILTIRKFEFGGRYVKHRLVKNLKEEMIAFSVTEFSKEYVEKALEQAEESGADS